MNVNRIAEQAYGGGDDAAALLTIIRAARIASDRTLEHAARRQLREQHGIKVQFARAAASPEAMAVI